MLNDTQAWPGLPPSSLDDLDQLALAEFLDKRRHTYPSDPYRQGYCLIRGVPRPPHGAGVLRCEVVHATPLALINPEALANAYQGHPCPDITMTGSVAAHLDASLDLEHTRLCRDPLTGLHRAACRWVGPASRPHHADHQCPDDDACWYGWRLKIAAINKTVIYVIGNYRAEMHQWETRWPD